MSDGLGLNRSAKLSHYGKPSVRKVFITFIPLPVLLVILLLGPIVCCKQVYHQLYWLVLML